MMRRVFSLLTAIAVAWCSHANASCVITGASQTEDDRTAEIPFGRINLATTYFQPPGTLLGSVVVPPTNYTYGGANAESVLWHCAVEDMANVHFLVATNGDDRVGGFYDIGGVDGLSDVYATWFTNVGLRLTMGGVVLTRYWRRLPVENYDIANGRAYVKLKHVPVLQAELYRVSTIPADSAASRYCASVTSGAVSGMGSPSAAGTPYTCIQPNAYIQLVGPGIMHDNAGEDSAYEWRFWGYDNGFGYGMRQANSLSNNAGCMARSATPQVVFPSISAGQLQSGGSSDAQFSVEVECSNSAVSGVASGQTALGIQVSPGAYSAAQSLGLINAGGGVNALVSDNYGNQAGLAAGVGIYLSRSDNGQALNFLGQPGTTGPGLGGSASPTGQLAGWYPVLDRAVPLGNPSSDTTQYRTDFSVSLRQLPGQQASPGQVRATAYVLVKVQ